MEQPQNQQALQSEKPQEEISIKDVVFIYFSKWKWIVASIAVCLCLAGLYIARTPKKYTASTSIEIKNEDSSVNSALGAFSDMGITPANSLLYNETAYFRSPDLMESVIEALGLDVAYSMRKGLKTISPYGSELPLIVSFQNTSEGDSGSFVLKVDDEELATVSRFRIGAEKIDFESGPFALGTRVKTPLGTITVSKGPAYESGESYKMNVSKYTIPAAAKSWAARLAVSEQSKEGTVIDISVSDQSKARAKDVLNALIKAYNDNWILDKNQVAVSTSNFINDRLSVIERELGNVDSDISSYKSAHMVPDVAATAAMYMTENQEINKRILELNNQLQVARFLKEHLMADANNTRTLPVNLGIDNPGIERLIESYNNLILQRNSLMSNTGASNPLVQDIDSRLKNMRASLGSSLDNEVHALSTDMRNVQVQHGNVSSQIASNPSQAKYLLTVERQQKVKESLYLYLLQKREENELNQAFTAYNTRIIARPSIAPGSSPKSSMIFGVAFFLGIAIPFVLVYFQESNNTKVRGREDLSRLGIPFLGEVPIYRASKKDRNTLMVVKSGERDAVNEAFRIVRTNLSFLGNNNSNVVMVSSFNPGSGKTFITMNIAQSLAIRGVKTLVIDGDLRRGSASMYAGSPRHGLSQYLNGKDADLDKLIKPMESSPNLFILPAGATPPNPTELLENGRFGEAIDILREEFSYIFIDCPPIGVIADPRIMETVSDRCILVVRAGLFERSMLPELHEMYSNKTYKNMAVILNGVKLTNTHYGYGYGYGANTKNYYTQI